MNRQSAVARLCAFLPIAAVVALACVSTSTSPTGPTRLTQVSGDSQTIVAGTNAAPFVVKVVGNDGQPFANVGVTFAVDSGAGTLNPATAITDASGLARTTYTGGTRVGTSSVISYVTELPSLFTRFSVKLKADVASALLAVGGDGAATLPDKALTLIAKAADKNGNGIPGVRVTWASGPGGSIAASGDTTDVNGLARATFTVGKNPGRYTATASAPSLGSVTFAVDAIATSSAALASAIDRLRTEPNAHLGPRGLDVPSLP
jgi:adhesin/invasin